MDGQTDRQTEWPSAIARFNIVRRELKYFRFLLDFLLKKRHCGYDCLSFTVVPEIYYKFNIDQNACRNCHRSRSQLYSVSRLQSLGM